MLRALPASLCSLLLTASSALASAPCSAASTTFECRLASVLHLLYVLAAILGIVLILCIAFAVRIYRRNRAANSKNSHS